jgi:hypothetical protein
MNFLKQKFKDELCSEDSVFIENGQVRIRHRSWTALDIVEMAKTDDGKNTVFDELYHSWFEEYLERQIDIADEILKQFDLSDRFKKLSEFYCDSSVIPFVGAGLSIPSGYPGWTTFLKKQRKQTKIPLQDFEQLLTEGKYEKAAQIIMDEFGAGAFSEAMDSAFGCSHELYGPVELLPVVFKTSVITTNFDNVIYRSFENANAKFSEILIGNDSAEIRRKLLSNDPILLMLHGKATSGKGRILTESEYDNSYIYGNTLSKTIQVLCNSASLLFLGCSLTVDRTITEIKKFVEKEGHENLPKHYAFLEVPESDELRIARQNQLAEYHIYPIWYPANSHDESIEALLVKLWRAKK